MVFSNNDSNPPQPPAVSVLLASEGSEESLQSLRLVLRTLAAQTIAERVEVVIVIPPGRRPNDLNGACDDDGTLHSVRFLQLAFRTWGEAMSAAVREASADVVVLGEDHAFVPPSWAKALVTAHAARPLDAGIGPAMNNANPRSSLSWSHLLMDYGRWLDPSPGGAMPDIPGHNSSYKRAALLAFDAETRARSLDRGGTLHRELQSRSLRLSVEPSARCYHLNPSRWGASVHMRFHAGRVFGASRSVGWTWLTRIAYVLGAPLLPLMRLRYSIANLRRAGRLREMAHPARAATLLALTLVGVVGEVCGYVLGAGGSPRVMLDFEFGRYRQMRPSDLRDGIRMDSETLPPPHSTRGSLGRVQDGAVAA